MRAKLFIRGGAAAVLVAATLSSGCGEFVRQSRSPSQLVIVSILTAPSTSGTVPTTFGNGPLLSDVLTGSTVFDDFGQVTLRVILKDPGAPGTPTAPSVLNDVTITRYRVTYSRSDGRNTPGADVPYPIEGAVTFTVRVDQTAAGVIELVRHVAKVEAPLAGLSNSLVVLTTIADVTLYGRDQAGNELSATGKVQINFANFN